MFRPFVRAAMIVLSASLAASAAGLPPAKGADEAAGQPADSVARPMPDLPQVHIDDTQAAAAGIHKLSSRRLVLYTDLPLGDEIRRLPGIFDQAFPQWCDYFRVRAPAAWQMTGFIMKDKARFQSTGLLPADLPHFLHGFSRNNLLWLYEQPSDYYRRHLLLHEGTHGFMNTVLGGCGPPWYMEGMAELLATHRLAGRPTDAQLDAGQPRQRARVGTHPPHQGGVCRRAGRAGGRRRRLPAPQLPRERRLCLVLGVGHAIGRRSPLSRPLPPTLQGDSRATRSRRGSTGSSSPTGGK